LKNGQSQLDGTEIWHVSRAKCGESAALTSLFTGEPILMSFKLNGVTCTLAGCFFGIKNTYLPIAFGLSTDAMM